MLKMIARAALSAPFFLAATAVAAQHAPETGAVLSTYADVAEAGYTDSHATAKMLQSAVEKLIAAPTSGNLEAARAAWIAARVPYQQTEAFRFGNAIVDDWEGKVNAWPLDEGLIDYVDASYGSDNPENPLFTANVIAAETIKIAGEDVDLSTITREILADKLQEAGGVEANVATGYHAIEFLLWGQDLNGTDAGAGNRPASDFDTKNCTNGNCERRAAYLKAVTGLLVDDLAWMAGQWGKDGDARKAVTSAEGNAGLKTIFTGLGSLSYGEMAGERMKLGLLLHDMGEGLADNRPEGVASGREWRTAPLWGIGLTETVSGHTLFLHDGRARNIEEAILWHGGEAGAARDAYAALTKAERDALIAFVNSL